MGLTTKEISSSSFNDMISSVDRRSEYVENRAGANVRLNNFLTPYTLDDKSSILNAPCGYSNGVYPSLRPVQTFGPELITNGDFATDSNWTKGTGWSISGGTANNNGTSGSNNLSQSNILVVGKKYKIDITVSNYVSGNVQVSAGAVPRGTMTANGTYTFYQTCTPSTTFYIIANSFNGSIDNVSVKEVIDADFDFTRGSAATRVTKDGLIKNVQILSDNLVQNGNFEEIGPEEVTNGDLSQIGSELVVNGDFSDSSWWGLDPVWSISGGSANCNGSGVIYKGGVLTIGKTYKVQVEISSYTSGTLTYPNAPYTLPSAVGSYTFYYKANSQTVSFTGTNFIGSIDNVSVKEVGQDWSFYNADADTNTRFENNSAILEVINSQFTRFISTTSPMTIGKFYKVTYQVTETDGTDLNIQYPNTSLNSSLGTHTVYIKATNVNIGFAKSSVGKITIDNVSVKEVGQNWDLTDGATITDNGVRILSDGTYQRAAQYNVLTVGKQYKVQYEIVENNSGKLKMSSSFGLTPIPSTVGIHTVYGEALQTFLTIERSGACDVTIDNISLIEITDDTDLPRIDYTGGTGSLLLEPQSTNLVTYSEDFSQWSKTGSTSVSSNDNISPDGTQNASTVSGLTGSGGNDLYLITGQNPASKTYSLSVYLKGEGILRLQISNNVNQGISENVTLTSDWKRHIVTGTFNSTLGTLSATLDDSGATATEYKVWGAMLEEGSYATSYIPTEGSTKTRLQDICNNAGSSDLINSTEGVLYAEIKTLTELGVFRQINLNDGTTSNRIYISKRGNNNNLEFRMDNPLGSLSFSIPKNTTDNYIKLAFRYGLNNFAVFIDGLNQNVNPAGNTFSANTLNNLELTSPINQNFEGNVKCLAVFKEALTDEELAKITSTTQQEVFYEMRDKMLQIDADYYEFGDYTTRLKKLF